MAINRAPFNALVDDDGSNTVGTPWNKQAIKDVILDPVDAALPTVLFTALGTSPNGVPAYISTANIPALPAGAVVRVTLTGYLSARPVYLSLRDLPSANDLANLLTLAPSMGAGSFVFTAVLQALHGAYTNGQCTITHTSPDYTKTLAIATMARNWSAPWQLAIYLGGSVPADTLTWTWTVEVSR